MKTTNQAFEELIQQRGWWKGILKNRQAAVTYKNRFHAGILSVETIESILSDSGYIVVQEKKWIKS